MFELTDQVFTRVDPLLPANSRRGKPWRDHRQVLGGIMWKLHTGRPWRDVPGRFGPWQTCYGRLRRWQRDGTWPRIWAILAAGEHRSGHGRRGQALVAAAPVAAAGAGLMTATPPRPPPAPGGPWVVSTTRGRPAAAAPPRSRSGSGPSWVAVAVLRAQPPPAPTRAVGAAWARTAARNPWATMARVACRYQAS
jgi:transposase